MRTEIGFEIEDVGGEAQDHYETTLATIERVKCGCEHCTRDHGHRVLCVWCEEGLDELRDEEYETQLELERRLAWLNTPITDVEAPFAETPLFGDYLFDTGVDFAWDALQDALWMTRQTKHYDRATHNEFAAKLRGLWSRRAPEGAVFHA